MLFGVMIKKRRASYIFGSPLPFAAVSPRRAINSEMAQATAEDRISADFGVLRSRNIPTKTRERARANLPKEPMYPSPDVTARNMTLNIIPWHKSTAGTQQKPHIFPMTFLISTPTALVFSAAGDANGQILFESSRRTENYFSLTIS